MYFTTFGVLLLLLVEGSHSSTKKCPDPVEILPCTCQEYLYPSTKFDCSRVTSNDELANVFNREFVETDFGRLVIDSNKYLKTIRAGDFGNVSFTDIIMNFGVLEEVEPFFLGGSYLTVTSIDLQGNNLVSFPFEEVPYFLILSGLLLTSNRFTIFPVLQSRSLKFVSFIDNDIGTLPVDALQQLPITNLAAFSGCQLSTILPGTFGGLPYLRTVLVANNGLQSLQERTFILEPDDSSLLIFDNMITNIEPNAFTGVTKHVDASRNSLQLFEEEVWRPSMDAGAKIDIEGNPFLCGCDMAWLVLNSTLMAQVNPKTTCDDGTLFIELDPAPYEEC